MRTILYRILQALVLVAVASSFAQADNFMLIRKKAAAGGGGGAGYVGQQGTTADVATPDYPYGNVGLAGRYAATTTGNITYCHAEINGQAAGSGYNMAVYDNSSTLLGDGTIQTGLTTGVASVQLDSPIAITQGLFYYIAYANNTSDDYYTINKANVTGNWYYQDTTYTVGNTMPAATWASKGDTNYAIKVWCDGTP